MRTRIFLLVLFASAISLTAQEVKVPSKVKDAFNRLYPNVTEVKWVKEGKTEFEAEFKLNGAVVTVAMDPKGNVKETETIIAKTELPKGVEEFVAQNYKGWNITESAKTVDAKGNVSFETLINKDKVKKELIFDKNGKQVVKKEKNEKGEKEENEKD